MGEPNRWMRIRHPDGFDEQRFREFVAHCAVFRSHVETLLAQWPVLSVLGGYAQPPYEFFEPTLSEDRLVASLPLGGVVTVGSRAAVEDGLSFLLWCYFPVKFQAHIDEALAETLDPVIGIQTNWRSPDEVKGLREAFRRRMTP